MKYFLLLTGLGLLSISGYFSVFGMGHLFNGIKNPIIIAAFAIMEISKVVASSYLYRSWDKMKKILRSYLLGGVIVLMIFTSIGIYGYLSNSYMSSYNQIQSYENVNNLYQLNKEQINNSITSLKIEVDINNDRIKTLNETRKNQESRLIYAMENGKFSITNIRKEIQEANAEINKLQTNNIEKNKEIESLRSKLLDSEKKQIENKSEQIKVDIGPLKFLSTVFNTDMRYIINIIIIFIICVFDPMGIMLIISYHKTIEINKNSIEIKHEKENIVEEKKINRRKKEMIYNVTHYDLDGIVSHIVLRNLFKDVRLFATTYGDKLQKVIDNILELSKTEPVNGIVFTDIHLTSDQLQAIVDSKIPFKIFDHHQQSLEYKDKVNGAINTEKCGAKILFDAYENKLNSLEHYNELKALVDLANDYDMWILKDKNSYAMNLLFWKYKTAKFYKKFSLGFKEFDDEDWTVIKSEIQKRRDVIDDSDIVYYGENKEMICLIHPQAGIVASDLQLFEKSHIVYCVFNSRTYNLSIRYKGDDKTLNIKDVVETFIHEYDNYVESFGGHPWAAAIQFNKSIIHAEVAFTNIIEKIYDIIFSSKNE